jgi:hypothetical protein
MAECKEGCGSVARSRGFLVEFPRHSHAILSRRFVPPFVPPSNWARVCTTTIEVMTVDEKCLPAAIDRLYAAVARLTDDAQELAAGELRVAPSLYEQLCDEVPSAARREGLARGASHSIAPVWVDALDLRAEIDDAVEAWHPAGTSTPQRLRALAARRWRPQDTQAVEQIATNVESWVASTAALLSRSMSSMCRRRARRAAPRPCTAATAPGRWCASGRCRSSPSTAAPAKPAGTRGRRNTTCTGRECLASRCQTGCWNSCAARRGTLVAQRFPILGCSRLSADERKIARPARTGHPHARTNWLRISAGQKWVVGVDC